MSKRQKLRQKLRNNPKSATWNDIQTLLSQYGFTIVRVRGSHHIFKYQGNDAFEQIVIPVHGTKVAVGYVKLALDAVDQVAQKEEDEADE